MCSSRPKIQRPPPVVVEDIPEPPRLASKTDIKDSSGKSKRKRRGRSDLVIDLIPNDMSGTGLNIPQ